MFRRLFIAWLIVSILGYGVALAADVHGELASDQIHTLSDHATNPGDTDDLADGDHCCHGVLHLLGLKSAGLLFLPTDGENLLILYSIPIRTFDPIPLYRPPILS